MRFYLTNHTRTNFTQTHTHPYIDIYIQGATVDAPAASGVTALWLAAGEGRTDIVQLLADQVRKGLCIYVYMYICVFVCV